MTQNDPMWNMYNSKEIRELNALMMAAYRNSEVHHAMQELGSTFRDELRSSDIEVSSSLMEGFLGTETAEALQTLGKRTAQEIMGSIGPVKQPLTLADCEALLGVTFLLHVEENHREKNPES